LGGACLPIGERRGACRFWWGNLRERDLFEDVGVDKRILLKWILKNSVGSMNYIDLAQDKTGGGFLNHRVP
jgi:hypothetical protein